MFSGAAVVAFCDWADGLGVTYWVDGGWGVDALLGEQTREHADLDLALDDTAAALLVSAAAGARLRRGGAGPARSVRLELRARRRPRPPDRPAHRALGRGRERRARSAGGRQLLSGRVAHRDRHDPGPRRRCVEPVALVAFHTGYAVDADDWADVSRLCARFGIPIPEDYAGFSTD